MSLHQTSKNFKTGTKIFFIVVVLYYFMILFVIPKSRNYIRKLIPEKNPPNPVYGQIDPPVFKRIEVTNKSPRYVLDTKDARMPKGLPNKMPVYTFKKPVYSYLAGLEAETNAGILGFSQGDLRSDLKGDQLKWVSLLSGGKLSITKSTGVITLDTNISGYTREYVPGNVDESTARGIARSLFSQLNRLDEYYDKGIQTVLLGKIGGNIISPVYNNISEAQIAKVDFFRSINNYRIMTPDPEEGLLQVYLRNPSLKGSPFNYPILTAYQHTIDASGNATYPILWPDEAWDQVKNNRGVLVSIRPKNSNPFREYEPTLVETIYINRIYLAYYETPELQTYLQPIYVFEGKYTTKGTAGGEVTIYFPAVTAEFIKSAN